MTPYLSVRQNCQLHVIVSALNYSRLKLLVCHGVQAAAYIRFRAAILACRFSISKDQAWALNNRYLVESRSIFHSRTLFLHRRAGYCLEVRTTRLDRSQHN